jgi:hypothetical protein
LFQFSGVGFFIALVGFIPGVIAAFSLYELFTNPDTFSKPDVDPTVLVIVDEHILFKVQEFRTNALGIGFFLRSLNLFFAFLDIHYHQCAVQTA